MRNAPRERRGQASRTEDGSRLRGNPSWDAGPRLMFSRNRFRVIARLHSRSVFPFRVLLRYTRHYSFMVLGLPPPGQFPAQPGSRHGNACLHVAPRQRPLREWDIEREPFLQLAATVLECVCRHGHLAVVG